MTLTFRHGSLQVWVGLNEGTALHRRLRNRQKAAIPEVPTQVVAVGFLGTGTQLRWERNNCSDCSYTHYICCPLGHTQARGLTG